MLIAIEGVDGAGKRTLTEGLRASFEASGRTVAQLAFSIVGVAVVVLLAIGASAIV